MPLPMLTCSLMKSWPSSTPWQRMVPGRCDRGQSHRSPERRCAKLMAIWCVCFCGVQWRAIGRLCEIPIGTLYGLFARWTRLGLWRRLLGRLRRDWRRACGDSPEPSAVVIDSRSCSSAPSCFDRGVDGGRGRNGRFVPAGICWVVERSFAWLSRYRQLNTIFERSKEHLIAFVAIAFISILARRQKRLITVDMSA
jgi:transposase